MYAICKKQFCIFVIWQYPFVIFLNCCKYIFSLLFFKDLLLTAISFQARPNYRWPVIGLEVRGADEWVETGVRLTADLGSEIGQCGTKEGVAFNNGGRADHSH